MNCFVKREVTGAICITFVILREPINIILKTHARNTHTPSHARAYTHTRHHTTHTRAYTHAHTQVSDEEIEAFIRKYGQSATHPVSTSTSPITILMLFLSEMALTAAHCRRLPLGWARIPRRASWTPSCVSMGFGRCAWWTRRSSLTRSLGTRVSLSSLLRSGRPT